ncbi:MAG TPA: response regulator transcription factor [Longimicrobiales bacterium]|nr:response regulator transcription factor [Longimicrobiales bacterium]
MPDPIRVLLADDHAVLRAGLRALIDAEPDLHVVGEASTGEEAVDQAALLRPDVVLMDLSMPGAGGLDATRRIASGPNSPRVLVLTMHPEEQYLESVLEAGGSGFLRKTSADEDVTRAIRTVAAKKFRYPKSAVGRNRAKISKGDEDLVRRLTERERQVLVMAAEGFSSREIGEKLFISPKTVDTYRARVMEKLELRHRSEMVHFALETGLLHAKSSPTV